MILLKSVDSFKLGVIDFNKLGVSVASTHESGTTLIIIDVHASKAYAGINIKVVINIIEVFKLVGTVVADVNNVVVICWDFIK